MSVSLKDVINQVGIQGAACAGDLTAVPRVPSTGCRRQQRLVPGCLGQRPLPGDRDGQGASSTPMLLVASPPPPAWATAG